MGLLDFTLDASDPNNPNGTLTTPEQLLRRQQMADALSKTGADYSPVQSGWQGAARLAQALMGGMMNRQIGQEGKAAQTSNNDAISQALLSINKPAGSSVGATLGTGATPPTATPQPAAPSMAPTSGAPVPPGNIPMTGGKQAFIDQMMPQALAVSKQTGLDPRVVVAQAALESGWGQSAPGNNFFGIKSHGAPGGQTLATTENVNGQNVGTTDSFRTYDSPAASVMGYANLLQSNPRYQPMLRAQGLDAQIAALGKSGYATDPNYAQKVAAIARGLPAPDGVSAINQAAPQQNPAMAYGPGAVPSQITGTPVAPPSPNDAPLSNFQTIPGASAPMASGGFAGGQAPAPSPDVPAPGAVPAGPAPMPPGAAPNAPPAAMRDTGDGSFNNPFLEGSPQAQSARAQAQTQGQQAQRAVQVQQLMGVISNPYSSQAQRQIAQAVLTKYMGQEQWTDAKGPNGMIGQRNSLTGEFKPLAEQADQKWGVIGEDNMGRKIYGRPPAPGQAAPANAASPAPQSADAMSLHGEEFIKTLDPGIQTQVRAIVEGRAPYPTGMLLKTPYGQQLAQYVTQADPSFETSNATSRTKVRSEFNAGGPSSPAAQITAGNTAIQHLGHLSDAAESLNNSDSSFPGAAKTYNAVKNFTSSGKDAVPLTEFNNIVGKYVEEATKFYRGTGGTEADIQRDIGHLNPNMTPSELHAAIKTQAELLQSKINALQDRWKQGMGPLVPDFPIVHPESQKQMDIIRKRAGGEKPNASGQPQASSAPAMPKTKADYDALPSGALWVDPDTGATKRKK